MGNTSVTLRTGNYVTDGDDEGEGSELIRRPPAKSRLLASRSFRATKTTTTTTTTNTTTFTGAAPSSSASASSSSPAHAAAAAAAPRRPKSTGERLPSNSSTNQQVPAPSPLRHVQSRERDSQGGSFFVEGDDTAASPPQQRRAPPTTTTTSASAAPPLPPPLSPNDLAASPPPQRGFIELPRGGFVVHTRTMGAIQFGIPPETIKDSLNRGMTVPKHFVVQGDMFDRKVGLSKAEFEFPIYYQYFLCRSKVNIVTFADHERRIRQALQQTLFGPAPGEYNVAEDYAAGTPAGMLPDFAAESSALDPSRELSTLDDVVHFTLFDEQANVAKLGEHVTIRLFTDFNHYPHHHAHHAHFQQQHDVHLQGEAVPALEKPKSRLMFEVREDGDVIALVPANVKLRSVAAAAALTMAQNGGDASSSTSAGAAGANSTHSKRFAKLQAKRNYELEERRHAQDRSNNNNNNSGVLTFNTGSGLLHTERRRSSLASMSEGGGGGLTSGGRRPSTSLLPLSLDSTGSLLQQQQLPTTPISSSLLPTPAPLLATASAAVSSSTPTTTTAAPFDIPVFGVTMMGTSHGFDPNGRTTGFVLWMNRRGVMIDPPPDSSQILEIMGIPPLAIEAVILTHVHADHDAGTFQKILRNRQIQLYTTRTIERSFIAKYSSITGFDQPFLRSLFNFHAVQCGVPLKIYDGEIRFHYSLHTIPCIGLEAHYGPHSMAYSADTRFDPALVQDMHVQGKVGKLRADQLSTFPYDHSLILYEMGVPPIHTPAETLRAAALDERHYRRGKPLKDRLFVVHTTTTTTTGSNKLDFAHRCRDWLTIRIMADQGKDKKVSEIISALANVEWLKPLPPDMQLKLAQQSHTHTYQPGETIAVLEEDGFSESMWIVMAGQVGAVMAYGGAGSGSAGGGGGDEEVLAVGESFGLSSLLDVLEMDSSGGGRSTFSRLKRVVPGVPLGIEFISASASALRRGFSTVTAPEKRPAVPADEEEDEDEHRQQVFKAKSRCIVLELPHQLVLKMVQGKPHQATKQRVAERLRRFMGWPNDGRWCALQRNDILVRLLTNQFAVREFLQNLSEDYVTYPEGHVLQTGERGSKPQLAYFIKEGVFRVTPNKALLKPFKPTVPDLPGGGALSEDAFECGRGSLVGDFNALVKHEEHSAYSVVCAEECQVYHFAREHLVAFLEEFPGIKFNFIDRILLGWMLDTATLTRRNSSRSEA